MESKKKGGEEILFPQSNEPENHVKTNWVFHMGIGTRCPYAPPVGLILGPLYTSQNAHKQVALPGEETGKYSFLLHSHEGE